MGDGVGPMAPGLLRNADPALTGRAIQMSALRPLKPLPQRLKPLSFRPLRHG
jgi:hypothetical protein